VGTVTLCTEYICIFHISKSEISPKCIGCFILNGTAPHAHIKEDEFLSSVPQPEVIQNLSLTVLSIELHKLFVVLQTGGPITLNLLEAIVEIRDDATCRDAYCRSFTENMVCAGTPSGGRGPCYVR
jgi:hypothetical protein